MSVPQRSSYSGPYNRIIDLQLSNIRKCLARFKAAVMLFESARQGMSCHDYNESKVYIEWQFMAARDGAVTLWTYLNAIHSLSASLHKVQIIGEGPDVDAFKLAKKEFLKVFPEAVVRGLRHAVCHLADNMENPSKLEEMLLQEAVETPLMRLGAGTLYSENLVNYTFQTAYKGNILQYDVNQNNIYKLTDITNKILDAVDLEQCWARETFQRRSFHQDFM